MRSWLIRLFDEHVSAWALVGALMFAIALTNSLHEFGPTVLYYMLPAAVGYRLVGRWIDEETMGGRR